MKLRNLDNELEYIWARDKFVRRKYLMQEMYQNFAEGSDWKLPDVSTMSVPLMHTSYFNSVTRAPFPKEQAAINRKFCT